MKSSQILVTATIFVAFVKAQECNYQRIIKNGVRKCKKCEGNDDCINTIEKKINKQLSKKCPTTELNLIPEFQCAVTAWVPCPHYDPDDEWNFCGSQCTAATCSEPNPTCAAECVSRYPKDKVLENGKCIPMKKCPDCTTLVGNLDINDERMKCCKIQFQDCKKRNDKRCKRKRTFCIENDNPYTIN